MEWHRSRHTQILAKYPHVRELFQPDDWQPARAFGWLLVLHIMVYSIRDLPLVQSMPLCIAIGPLLAWWAAVALHDICHGNATRDKTLETILLSIATFLTAGLPMNIYQYYHKKHHAYLWKPGHDLETTALTCNVGWYIQSLNQLLGIMYVVLFKTPEILGQLCTQKLLLTDGLPAIVSAFVIMSYLGPRHFLLFWCSIFSQFAWHPLNSRAFREHHIMLVTKQPTMSSYSPVMRWLTGDLCLHVEHHDFPNIPNTRVRELRKIAPEFYDSLLSTRTIAEDMLLMVGVFPTRGLTVD